MHLAMPARSAIACTLAASKPRSKMRDSASARMRARRSGINGRGIGASGELVEEGGDRRDDDLRHIPLGPVPRGLLARAELVPKLPTDWDDAARIYRAGRRQGVTIRRLVSCLIAAIALRSGEPVLHNDVDFDAIARVVPLVVSRG